MQAGERTRAHTVFSSLRLRRCRGVHIGCMPHWSSLHSLRGQFGLQRPYLDLPILTNLTLRTFQDQDLSGLLLVLRQLVECEVLSSTGIKETKRGIFTSAELQSMSSTLWGQSLRTARNLPHRSRRGCQYRCATFWRGALYSRPEWQWKCLLLRLQFTMRLLSESRDFASEEWLPLDS